MKGVVIQGGGSFGAFTVGRLCARQKTYDVAVGSSTGALIAPFALAGGEYLDLLREAYTTMDNGKIYSKYPFWKNGFPNIVMALWSLIRKRKGITDTKPLRALIGHFYTEALHNHLIDSGKDLYVTVCELNSNTEPSKYFRAADHAYSTFCDLIWASTLIPGILEPLTINGVDLVDGGTTENVGLKKALEVGCNDIDVFLHRHSTVGYKPSGKNWLHNIIRAAMLQRSEVMFNDLFRDAPPGTSVQINYLPGPLVGGSFAQFDRTVMQSWFDQGYSYETGLNVGVI